MDREAQLPRGQAVLAREAAGQPRALLQADLLQARLEQDLALLDGAMDHGQEEPRRLPVGRERDLALLVGVRVEEQRLPAQQEDLRVGDGPVQGIEDPEGDPPLLEQRIDRPPLGPRNGFLRGPGEDGL